MTDCLQAGYNVTRQSVIAIFFLYLLCARFITACSPGLVYLGPYSQVIFNPNKVEQRANQKRSHTHSLITVRDREFFKGQSILICVSWLALRKGSTAVKTCMGWLSRYPKGKTCVKRLQALAIFPVSMKHSQMCTF